jgi:hypothetical protein
MLAFSSIEDRRVGRETLPHVADRSWSSIRLDRIVAWRSRPDQAALIHGKRLATPG